MFEDVRQLLAAVGLAQWSYREIRTEEERAAATARWPLLTSASRGLAGEEEADPAEEPASDVIALRFPGGHA
jgi:hypothetical protein